MIDLHCHTTISDGTFTPEELVALAIETGIEVLAITDHDRTDALTRAKQAALGSSVHILAGVELSATWNDKSVDILGYGFDAEDSQLMGILADLQRVRGERVPLMIAKFAELHILIDEVKLTEGRTREQVGRPHFAQYLIEHGFVGSFQEAFERYLKDGGRCYVPKRKLSPAEAIGAIVDAGGVASLAHPYFLGMPERELRQFLRLLCDDGLGGLEIYYPTHSRDQIALYEALAKEFGLLPTGGSDFHGAHKPHVRLGTGYNGNLNIPRRIYEALAAQFA